MTYAETGLPLVDDIAVSPHPFVSVVIPAFNRRDLLIDALDALEHQTYPSDRMEVIVIDNGGSDGTTEELRRRRPPWRLRGLRFEANHTPAEARNAGVEIAAGAMLAFTDSDCAPSPQWIERGVAAFGTGTLIGVVQGRTLPDPAAGPTGPWCATQRIDQLTGRYETCNVFYRADALREVGEFPPDLGFFGEDIAAGWGVRRLGLGDRFASDAVVYHAVAYPPFSWFLRRAQLYGNWNAVVKRYPETRRELLWCRLFLRPRDAALTMAVAGVLLAPWRRGALALVLPYARLRIRRPMSRAGAKGAAKATVHDVAMLVSLARGSVRERCLVL